MRSCKTTTHVYKNVSVTNYQVISLDARSINRWRKQGKHSFLKTINVVYVHHLFILFSHWYFYQWIFRSSKKIFRLNHHHLHHYNRHFLQRNPHFDNKHRHHFYITFLIDINLNKLTQPSDFSKTYKNSNNNNYNYNN